METNAEFKVVVHSATYGKQTRTISVLSKQTSTREGARMTVVFDGDTEKVHTLLVTQEFPDKLRSALFYLVLVEQTGEDAAAVAEFFGPLVMSAKRKLRTPAQADVPVKKTKKELSPEEEELRKLRSLAGRVKRLPRELETAALGDCVTVQRTVARVRKLEEDLGEEQSFEFPVIGVWAHLLEMDEEIRNFEDLSTQLATEQRWTGLLGLIRHMKTKYPKKFFSAHAKIKTLKKTAQVSLRRQVLDRIETSLFNQQWKQFIFSDQPFAAHAPLRKMGNCQWMADLLATSQTANATVLTSLVTEKNAYAYLAYLTLASPELVTRSKLFPIIKSLVGYLAVSDGLTAEERAQLLQLAKEFSGSVRPTRAELAKIVWALVKTTTWQPSGRETTLLLRHAGKFTSEEERNSLGMKSFAYRMDKAQGRVRKLIKLASEGISNNYQIDNSLHTLHCRIWEIQNFQASVTRVVELFDPATAWDQQWMLEICQNLGYGRELIDVHLARADVQILQLLFSPAGRRLSRKHADILRLKTLLEKVRMGRVLMDSLSQISDRVSVSLQDLRNFRSHAKPHLEGLSLFDETLGTIVWEAETEIGRLLNTQWTNIGVLSSFLENLNPRLVTGNLSIGDCVEIVQLRHIRDKAVELETSWHLLSVTDAYNWLMEIQQFVRVSEHTSDTVCRNKWLADVSLLWSHPIRDADEILSVFSAFKESYNDDSSVTEIVNWTHEISDLVNSLSHSGDWTILTALSDRQADCRLARRHSQLRDRYFQILDVFSQEESRNISEWRALQSEIFGLLNSTDVTLSAEVRGTLDELVGKIAQVEQILLSVIATVQPVEIDKLSLEDAGKLLESARSVLLSDSAVERLATMVDQDKETLQAIDREASRCWSYDKIVLPELVDLATRLDKLNFHADTTASANLDKALVVQSVEILERWAAARNRKVCPGPPWLFFVQIKQLADRLDASAKLFVDQVLQFSERILKEVKPDPPASAAQAPVSIDKLEKFCRFRILLPLLPISLHEPMEQLRSLLEKRHAGLYRLQTSFLQTGTGASAGSGRRLESCSVAKTADKTVVFKVATRPGKSLFEISDSEKLSSAFKKRMQAGNAAPVPPRKLAERILKRVAEFPALLDLLNGQTSVTDDAASDCLAMWSSMATSSLMAAMDIPEDEAVRVEKSAIFADNFGEYSERLLTALSKIQQDATYGEKLLGIKRPLNNPAGGLPVKKPSISVAPMGGFVKPPGSAANSGIEVLWRGNLLTAGAEMAVSLLPLVKEAPRTLKQRLTSIAEFQFEGSLSMTKFRAHYEKCVSGKRKSLVHCVVGADWPNLLENNDISALLFSSTSPHAVALSAVVSGDDSESAEKVKVWLVPPEGSRFVTGLIDVNIALTGNVAVIARPSPGIFEEIESLLAKSAIDHFPWLSMYWDCPDALPPSAPVVPIATLPAPIATVLPAAPAPTPAPAPAAAPVQPPGASLTALLASFKGAGPSEHFLPKSQPHDDYQHAAAALREALSRKPGFTQAAPVDGPPSAHSHDMHGSAAARAIMQTVYISSSGQSSAGAANASQSGSNWHAQSHPPQGALELNNTCNRFNNGQCDFGDKCKFIHVCNICRGPHPQWQHVQHQGGAVSGHAPSSNAGPPSAGPSARRGWRNL